MHQMCNSEPLNPQDQKIRKEIEAILLGMFTANPTFFLKVLAKFDRQTEWKFAVERVLKLGSILEGKSWEDVKKANEEATKNRTVKALAAGASGAVLGAGLGYMLFDAPIKGAIAGFVAGGAVFAAGEVVGAVGRGVAGGVKTLGDAVTAVANNIDIEQLEEARNIFHDRQFEAEQQKKRFWGDSPYTACYDRIMRYKEDPFWPSLQAVFLNMNWMSDPKSSHGVPSYPQKVRERQDLLNSADGVKYEIAIVEQENKKQEELLIAQAERTRGYYILKDKTLVAPENTRKATHQAIQRDLSAKTFSTLKDHLSLNYHHEQKTKAPDEQVELINAQNAKANLTAMSSAIELAQLTSGSEKVHVSDKAVYRVSNGLWNNLFHRATGWLTGNCIIEKQDIQKLKAILCELSNKENERSLKEPPSPQNAEDNSVKIKALEANIQAQKSTMDQLMLQLDHVLKNGAAGSKSWSTWFKEQWEGVVTINSQYDLKSTLEAIQSCLMDLKTSARKIELLGGGAKNAAVKEVNDYIAKLTAKSSDAQQIQDVLTNIDFQCNNVPERLLLARLQPLEAMQDSAVLANHEKIALQKEQWMCCKAILEVYPEDTEIREKYDYFSDELGILDNEKILDCEKEHERVRLHSRTWGLAVDEGAELPAPEVEEEIVSNPEEESGLQHTV